MLPWLNIAVALSSTSKITTASTGGPEHGDGGELDQHRQADLHGWKRAPVVTS
jgi:hypothetical protein